VKEIKRCYIFCRILGKVKEFIVWKLEIDLWHNENNADDYLKCLKQELTKWKCITDAISCKTKAIQLMQ